MIRKTIHFAVALLLTTPLLVEAGPITDPLKNTISNIPGFIAEVLKIMVEVGLPIVAFFILLAGFQFIAAGGNQDKLKKAKENFVYVMIGALLILGAWIIATLIANTVYQVVGSQIDLK